MTSEHERNTVYMTSTSTVMASTRPAQDQARQPSRMEGRGAGEFPHLFKDLQTIAMFCNRESEYSRRAKPMVS